MNKRKIKKAKSAMKGYAFIGFNLIGVLIFWIVPMFFSFIISMLKQDYSKGIKGIRIQGLSNYMGMWRGAWLGAPLINNIVSTIGYVVVLTVLSSTVAYILSEYVVGKKFVQLGLYLSYIVNIVAMSAIWLALFSNNGPILDLLHKIGVGNPSVSVSNFHRVLSAIVLICIWQSLGCTVILLLSGTINVPRDLYEATAVDEAGGTVRIWHVTTSILSGIAFFIVTTSTINSLKVFGLISLVTHGGPGIVTTMLVYNIYCTAFQFGELEFTPAQGIVLLATTFFITWIQFRIQKRNEV